MHTSSPPTFLSLAERCESGLQESGQAMLELIGREMDVCDNDEFTASKMKRKDLAKDAQRRRTWLNDTLWEVLTILEPHLNIPPRRRRRRRKTTA